MTNRFFHNESYQLQIYKQIPIIQYQIKEYFTHNLYPHTIKRPGSLSLLRKDRHQLAHSIGFHGFLVSLPAGCTLPDNKPTNLPSASHSLLSQ